MSIRSQWTLILVGFALTLGLIPASLLELSVRRQVAAEREAWAQRRTQALELLLENAGLQLLASARRLGDAPDLEEQLRRALSQPQTRQTEALAGELAGRSGLEMLLLLREDGRVLSSSLHPEAFDRRHPRADLLLDALRHAPFVWRAWASQSDPPYLGVHERIRIPGETTVHVFAARPLDDEFLREQARLAEWNRLSLRPGSGEHALPVAWQLPEPWHFEGSWDESPVLDDWMRLRSVLLLALAVLLVIALVAAPLLARRGLRPLRQLIGMTSDVAEGRPLRAASEPMPVEIAGVADALATMASQLSDAETRTRAAERRAAWRGIADRIAHEIKNALSPLALALDNLETLQGRDDETARRHAATSLRSAREQLQSLDRLLNEFRSFARMPEPTRSGLDAHSLAAAAIEAARTAREQTRFVVRSGPTLADLRGDGELLRRALLNLLLNAADAVDEAGGDGEVELLYGQGPGERHWWLAVRDRGVGLPPGFADRLGEPYYTTKTDGTGLGLAIVLQIAEAHGGRLLARARDGGGSEFRLELPRDAQPLEAGS